ncbi:UPF0047 protein YjbQ,UPF0047 protein C4A8.02c [Lepeophtheirus salmonis]|uniref:UPF0047 protein YjbQ,UPF0047 protein C4A8.02c n=1 Tax=Lepeophtheirus salmonis TaxID=72036 RepID=A0A7R8CKW4_LEPSM|nr:UPF0047 protein YjbQ,UPF0047 protein C4A8.02c [Lepeophtheirus salmonis]CAF2817988.1 UPF0047 protein YjbQ,UPF0047 protein C4A8.02c [Lepeophtheirus salmonis]
MARAEPDLEFEGLLKRQHTRVKYFQRSLMNAMDLERAKALFASCISEIIDLIVTRPKYGGTYKSERGQSLPIIQGQPFLFRHRYNSSMNFNPWKLVVDLGLAMNNIMSEAVVETANTFLMCIKLIYSQLRTDKKDTIITTNKGSGSGMGGGGGIVSNNAQGLFVGQPAWLQKKIHLRPQHRGIHLITEEILRQLPELSQFVVGLMHVQLLHTSASLAMNENWDPDVRDDMEMMLNRLVPEDIPYRHSCEGPDDMPAHVKACFLGSNLTLPVSDGKLNLGTWQGIWLCEHRDRAGSRKIIITVNGAIRDADRTTPVSSSSPLASTISSNLELQVVSASRYPQVVSAPQGFAPTRGIIPSESLLSSTFEVNTYTESRAKRVRDGTRTTKGPTIQERNTSQVQSNTQPQFMYFE